MTLGDSLVGIDGWLWAGESGDLISMVARFNAPHKTAPGAHISSCTMALCVISWVKRPGGALNHPFPSNADVKEE
jgi:hypothetical protein